MTVKELKAEVDALKTEVAELKVRLLLAECNRPVQYVPYYPYPWLPYTVTWGSGSTSIGNLGSIGQLASVDSLEVMYS